MKADMRGLASAVEQGQPDEWTLLGSDRLIAVGAATSICRLARNEAERRAGGEVVADALKSREWAIRHIAVKSIRVCHDASVALPLLDRMTGDAHSYVRSNAVVEMGGLDLDDDLLVPRFIELLSHDDPVVRFSANRNLETLSGKQRLYGHSASLEKRQAGIRRWQDWWSKNRGTF